MNALVVYDSKFGNTERLALAIAGALDGAQAVRVDHRKPLDLDGVDLLVIGSPTQGWRSTTAIQEFLKELAMQPIHDLPVACFDTRFDKPRWMTGSAAHTIAKKLRQAEATLVVPPECFFVTASEGPLEDGEIERATAWAQTIQAYAGKHALAARR
jgi:flavodoxin